MSQGKNERGDKNWYESDIEHTILCNVVGKNDTELLCFDGIICIESLIG